MAVNDEQLPLFSTPEYGPEPESPARERASALGPGASLSAAILAWRHQLEREHRPENTVKAFVGDLNLAAQYLGAFKNVGQVSQRDLEGWLTWQRTARKCSPKTYARRITSLKAFFRWLHQSTALGTDPAAALIQQSVLSPLPEILSEAEVQAALSAATELWHAAKTPNPTPYVLLTLLLRTAIKKGECLGLEPNHIDLSNAEAPVLWVRHKDTRHPYKERKLALDSAWAPAYRSYLEYRADYLARQQRGQSVARRKDSLFPWSPRRLEYWLQDIGQAAHLTKQISFDMCRWTCAVHDVRAGLDEVHLRQKLGLSKIQWREIGMKLNKLVQPGL